MEYGTEPDAAEWPGDGGDGGPAGDSAAGGSEAADPELAADGPDAGAETVAGPDAGAETVAGPDAGAETVAGLRPRSRPATGEARVDAALRLLDRLPGLPVSDHPELFEQVHAQLTEVLGELESGSAGQAGQHGN
jgi:hypothetical protein